MNRLLYGAAILALMIGSQAQAETQLLSPGAYAYNGTTDSAVGPGCAAGGYAAGNVAHTTIYYPGIGHSGLQIVLPNVGVWTNIVVITGFGTIPATGFNGEFDGTGYLADAETGKVSSIGAINSVFKTNVLSNEAAIGKHSFHLTTAAGACAVVNSFTMNRTGSITHPES